MFTEFNLLNVSQRTFWQSPIEFDDVELSNDEPDEDERLIAFRRLAAMQRLDWSTMRSNIAGLVRSSECVTLPDLLEAHPPTSGSIEVLGYIQLAHDDGHNVDESQTEVVYLESQGRRQPYEIPRVVFLPERLRSLRAGAGSGGS